MSTNDLKLEVVVIPVSDVDRAKKFYANLGWRLDADFPLITASAWSSSRRPARAARSSSARKLRSAPPGSAHGLYLMVSDIEAARAELVARGVKVSDVFHAGTPGAQFQPDGTSGRVGGPAPNHGSYSSFATFSDPDGNGWLLQEVTTRLPGRVDLPRRRSLRQPIWRTHCGVPRPPTASTRSAPGSATRTGQMVPAYIVAEQAGKELPK